MQDHPELSKNYMIKRMDAPGVDIGSALFLCDEAAEPVGKQKASFLSTEVGHPTVFSVDFVVDGLKIRIAE